jgi:hypothetical protein
MRTLRNIAFLMSFCFGLTLCAKADSLVLKLDGPSSYVVVGAGSGIAQAVTVSESLSIDDIGFYLTKAPTGTVDYFVYDATTSTLTLGPDAISSPTTDWNYLSGLSVNLTAGDTYYFGLYDSTGSLQVGKNPATSTFMDGLGVPSGVSSLDFTGDTPTTTAGPADLALRLYSNGYVDLAPEPSSLMLLGTGILAGAAVLRRKFMQ